ncbi:response regulator [Larkinella insperata]|uniref:Response regulator n=1 Tax=Larkinella insperata TaxID=332158 RepID=A0ABW3Q6G4_9BACT
MIKVAIFEDHKARRGALKLLIDLQPDMYCIADYENCSGLVENLRYNVPHVVLMDINMPRVDGITGVKLLQKHYPDTYIIIQTVFDDDEKIFDCLRSGAHGYILKKVSNEKLIDAVKEVVNGGVPMTPSVAKRVLNFFNKNSIESRLSDFNLSSRELDILTELVNGLSHKMIAAKLCISVYTVGNHIKSIYQKLHVHSVSEAVATALQNNLL